MTDEVFNNGSFTCPQRTCNADDLHAFNFDENTQFESKMGLSVNKLAPFVKNENTFVL